MTNQAISQNNVKELCEDVSYLQDEAEALKYLIDRVPYDEQPPEGYSIINMLRFIDFSQHHYYRPAIEKAITENRLINLKQFEGVEAEFDSLLESESENETTDIQTVLNKLIKHRAALGNVIDNISLFEWEKNLFYKNDREITLFDLISDMIRKERGLLKKVADLVLIYQKEKEHQRDIHKRSPHSNSNNS